MTDLRSNFNIINIGLFYRYLGATQRRKREIMKKMNLKKPKISKTPEVVRVRSFFNIWNWLQKVGKMPIDPLCPIG